MLETVTKIDVTENDIDDLGHVNNNIYGYYFMKARKEWIQEAGLLYNQNIGAVVRKLEINFLKESRLGDSLKVITRPICLGNKSFLLKQDIYNQNDVHITDATVTLVMFDLINRKSINIEEKFRCYFE